MNVSIIHFTQYTEQREILKTKSGHWFKSWISIRSCKISCPVHTAYTWIAQGCQNIQQQSIGIIAKPKKRIFFLNIDLFCSFLSGDSLSQWNCKCLAGAICSSQVFNAFYQLKISRTCISEAFLSVVYFCDFMSELFHQNKFFITKPYSGYKGGSFPWKNTQKKRLLGFFSKDC